ncbi:MAG: hypothetical protein Q9227_005920 [Pyrenula ochraceoflavens]
MSATANPISPTRFAAALESLPLSSLYAKARELDNSISHLRRSNAELQNYSDGQEDGDGDRECLDAIRENEQVIARMRERVGLCVSEVERRGGGWHDGVGEDAQGVEEKVNGVAVDGDTEEVVEIGTREVEGETRTQPRSNGAAGGSLTDDELRRRLRQQMGDDGDGNDGGGLHL